MFHLALLFAAAAAAAPPSSGVPLYRVDLNGGPSSWAMGKPQPNGALLLFRHYPDGALMSVRLKDVKQVVASDAKMVDGKKIRPGDAIEIGSTGGGISGTPAGASAVAAGSKRIANPAPGQRPDGMALLDPNRPYNQAWDSTMVPGLNMGYPNSPNDYVEGKTIAYPPSQAVQAAPGDVPMAPPSRIPSKRITSPGYLETLLRGRAAGSGRRVASPRPAPLDMNGVP